MQVLTLSLVIPCYNEGENLLRLLARCAEVCALEPRIDVILVDNGSIDATQKILASWLPHPQISTVRVPVNRGYGFGILSGLEVAKGDIIGWSHADMQTDPMDVVRALAEFDAAPDPRSIFVKGRRGKRPIRDVVFTYAMSGFANIMLGLSLKDINAQPNLFHREFINDWVNAPQDFALDLFAYVQALQLGIEVRRFNVDFRTRVAGLGSNEGLLSKLRYSRRSALDIICLRKRLVGK